MQYPPSIQRLIDHFRALPGVGPKTAARFVMHLLKRSEDELRAFGHALVDLKQGTRLCNTCLNFTLQSPCPICSDSKRDPEVICVVAKPQDLLVIEGTGEYTGVYHVLHGTLNPIEGVTPDQLKIKELLGRVEGQKGKIKEVIFAMNPDMEGESTAIYLTKLLQKDVPKITRLARGLPMGSDLEYADEITLTAALKGRREV
jgi:recombination protein RecR